MKYIKLIKSILLVVIAILLLGVLIYPSLIVAVIYSFTNKGTVKNLAEYFRDVALSIDQTGNTICQHLFNAILIEQHSIYRFGNMDETISSVLGKNLVNNSLTKTGRYITYILDTLDNNHSIKSIDNTVGKEIKQ